MACTKEVVRPEAVASRLIKVVETTGVGSLAEAGGGRGAAGEHHTSDVHIPRKSIRLITSFLWSYESNICSIKPILMLSL